MTLVPVWKVGDLELTTDPYLVPHGTDYGSPENVAEILRSLLGAGDIEVSTHTGNRTIALPVIVEGSDMVVLAEAEAALVAECDKPRNEVYCDPGDGFGAPFVFEVFRGQLVFNRDDEWEQQGYRSYTLTFRALPYPKSATETTTAALAASGSTTTLVDAMSATTNWTGTVNGASVSPATAGGALSVTSSALTGTVAITMTRTASITTSSTKYLPLDWKIGTGAKVTAALGGFGAIGDGVVLTKVAESASPTAGYTRTTFYVAAASVAVLTFSVSTTSGWMPMVRTLTLDNLDRSDVRPAVSTAKQQLRILPIGGSAPTTGSIAVEHATNALGDVLLYTCPDDATGYTPACRQYRISGPGPTADAANTVSGSYDLIDTSTTYDVPVSALPEGEYLVMARMTLASGSSPASVTWNYGAYQNTTLIGSSVSVVTSLTFPAGYQFHRLGMLHLPLIDSVPQAGATNRFVIVATAPGSVDIRLDEFYLLNMTTGRLTQVACGTAAPGAGSTSNRLWIDSPSLDNDGLGRYLRGYAADQSDAYSAYPAMVTPGVHEFASPSVKVFSVTSNTLDASVSFRHRIAGHTHIAS